MLVLCFWETQPTQTPLCTLGLCPVLAAETNSALVLPLKDARKGRAWPIAPSPTEPATETVLPPPGLLLHHKGQRPAAPNHPTPAWASQGEGHCPPGHEVVLNRGYTALWEATRSFQGCCGIPCNTSMSADEQPAQMNPELSEGAIPPALR